MTGTSLSSLNCIRHLRSVATEPSQSNTCARLQVAVSLRRTSSTFPSRLFLATARSALVYFLWLLSTATPLTTVSATMGTDNDDIYRSSTPPNPIPQRYISTSFERFVRENEMADWASAFTLLGEYHPMSDMGWIGLRCRRVCWIDTVETFFDARIDLIQRTLTKHSDRLKTRAEVAMNKMKTPAGEDLAENLDREMQKFKLKVRINCPSLVFGPCRD